MPFITTISCRFIPGSNTLELLEPLIYDCPRTRQRFVVPVGTQSDGASIPKLAWSIIGHPFDPRWRKEAVLHDWFYRLEYKIVSRKMADQLFYDGLRTKGLSYTKAQSMYLAVRSFGWYSWRGKL